MCWMEGSDGWCVDIAALTGLVKIEEFLYNLPVISAV